VLCREFECSRKTLYKILAPYRDGTLPQALPSRPPAALSDRDIHRAGDKKQTTALGAAVVC